MFMFEQEWMWGALLRHQLSPLPTFNIPHSSEFEGAAYNKARHKCLMRNT